MNKSPSATTPQTPVALGSPVVFLDNPWTTSKTSLPHQIRTVPHEEKHADAADASLIDLDVDHIKSRYGYSESSKILQFFECEKADACEPSQLRSYIERSWQFSQTGSLAAAVVLAQNQTLRIAHGGSVGIAEQATALIAQHKLDDTVYIYDLGQTTRLYRAWVNAMPRVTPFYAVKCNPDSAILSLLAALGAGFDCASGAEIQLVKNINVSSDRIVFANPCKRISDIKTGKRHGVGMTTFDTEFELEKLANVHPDVGCILRVRCDDPDARIPLGLKYGADPSEAPALLQAAKRLGMKVMGVSFHVGGSCKNLTVYEEAIAVARIIFDQAAELGFEMTILDIGGGFTGHFDANGEVIIASLATVVNAALDLHFPPGCGVRVISEPGRFFAEASATLFTPIFGRRDRPIADADPAAPQVHKDYWLTDGLYGSFNCIIYDDQRPAASVLRSPLLGPVPSAAAFAAEPRFKSTLWGPTCDSADFIYKDVELPELRVGDWCQFPHAGAYTVAGACDFNGIAMSAPNKFYVFSDCAVDARV